MVAGFLMLVAALGIGKLPVHSAVARFPDISRYVGNPSQQVSGLFQAITEDAGTEMRTAGPGPQQMAARWRQGKLTADERVAILLTGGGFHEPVLLRAYLEAVQSQDPRERKAAGVGFGWLCGDRPLWMRPEDDRAENWAALARMIEDLLQATRERTLVGIWANSYLAAIGAPHRSGFVFSREPDGCLNAMRELATPADLGELVALWPQMSDLRHRHHLRRTLEIVTYKLFQPQPTGSRVTSGEWEARASVEMVDAWVNSLCTTQRGDVVSVSPPEASETGAIALGSAAGPWIRIVNLDYPAFWPLAVEKLSAFGAPAVHLDRSNLDNPRNREQIRRVRKYFPISAELFKQETSEMVRSNRSGPNQGQRRPPIKKKEVDREEPPGQS